MNPITWLQRVFTDADAQPSPLPPHVANLRLDMRLMHLHMDQAAREQDPRTKVGYVFTGNKEHRS